MARILLQMEKQLVWNRLKRKPPTMVKPGVYVKDIDRVFVMNMAEPEDCKYTLKVLKSR